MRSLLIRASAQSALLLLSACTPPPPPAPPPVVIAPTPVPTAEPVTPPDPAAVSVAIVRAPKAFALDGDLGEWGSLLPPEPVEKKGAPKGPDTNPRDAASHVAVAVTNDALLIGADLGEAARDGIWLRVGGTPPDLPSIGEYQPGGGVMALNCDANPLTGEAYPPEQTATCNALVERQAALVTDHEARFVRTFRVDREGARLMKPDGTLFKVDGTKGASKSGPKGATIEASIPLLAMPRVNEAPLVSLRLWARAATAPKPPEITGEQWTWLDLPQPFSFEPYGELRARALQAIQGRTIYPAGLSYQPGDPLHVESARYPGAFDRHAVLLGDDVLYKKEHARGDIEVGYVTAYLTSLAVLKAGKVVELVQLNGSPRGVVERDGEIHVVSFSQYTAEDTWMDQASWSVIAVAPNGTIREDIVSPDGAVPGWDQVSGFSSKTFDSFGVRGATRTMSATDKPIGVEVTWRWDKKARVYLAKSRSIPVPSKPKPRAKSK